MPGEDIREAMTESKKGNRELRSIFSRGRFALVEYRDMETKERADEKLKLVLQHDDGKVEEFFVIPLKQANRSLLLRTEKPKGPKVKAWNPKSEKVEEVMP